MKKRLLFVSAGHSSKKGRDNGALGVDGITEGQRTEEFRNLFVQECKHLGITCNVDGSDTILLDTINQFKKWVNKDAILIEFHFNASANNKAEGVEVLVPRKGELTEIERKIATEFCEAASRIMSVKNRGVKTEDESARGSLGWMRLAGNNILPEICFITNKLDLVKYDMNKKDIARAWALIVQKYINYDE